VDVVSGIAIYLIIWWVVLFCTLPFGIKSHAETGDDLVSGQDRGAPVLPNLARKALWTTAIATVLFVAYWMNQHFGWVGLDWFPGPELAHSK
jgi:predicted secreted protein